MNNQSRAIYKITGRYMNGASVYGYHLVGLDGSNQMVERLQVMQLAQNGLIENCTVSNYRGEILLKGKGIKLNELPSQNISDELKRKFFTLKERILDGNRVIGYIVIDGSGALKNVRDDMFKKMLKSGLISNASFNSMTGKLNVHGNEIPSVQFSEIKNR